ncbi:MAG: DUF370 domain-containing protein [Firmicutes bacterium]|nr:DUF370 domain-containing protein [Bacillota bacterium]
MFLHIGGSDLIAAADIIGIFDFNLKEKQCNKEFLQTAAPTVDDPGEIKSFIVTNNGVFFSPIAPGTLKKRFEKNLWCK